MIEILPLKTELEPLLPRDLATLPKEGTMLVLDRGELLGYATARAIDGRMTIDRYALFIADPGHRLLDGLIKAMLNRLDLSGHPEVLVVIEPDYSEYFEGFDAEATAEGYLVSLPAFFERACHAKKKG